MMGIIATATVRAQSVEDLIAKHIAARGGLEKIKALQSMRAEASIALQGMDIPLKLYAIDKKAFKLEIFVMDAMGYQLLTDTKGWTFFPFQGQTEPKEFSAEEFESAKAQLDLQGPLVDYKTKNIKVESGGKQTIEGKECSVIKFTRANGDKGTIWLDDKFLILQKTESVKANGQSVDQTTIYRSYQTSPEGFVYASAWTAANGGELTLTKFEANPKIEESVFKP